MAEVLTFIIVGFGLIYRIHQFL